MGEESFLRYNIRLLVEVHRAVFIKARVLAYLEYKVPVTFSEARLPKTI
jgi:hypothetical protein